MQTRTHSVFFFGLVTAWIVLCLTAGGVIAVLSLGQRNASFDRAELAKRTTRFMRAAETAIETAVSAAQTIQTDRMEAGRAFAPLSVSYLRYENGISLRGTEPKILIYHTHTQEAYFPTEQYPYRESSKWRTSDSTRSVVAVGERLKEILEKQYGFCVIHDTTNHEPPKLASAYERSEQTMRAYAERYPSIVLFIDLHRDAYGNDPKAPADYVTVDGTECARMMFVVGRGEAYSDKPYYQTNFALASRITEHLNEFASNFTRPIRDKKGRYNQHIGAHCLLVEVGHNANTLEQALASMPYLAESIAFAIAETEETVRSWIPTLQEN